MRKQNVQKTRKAVDVLLDSNSINGVLETEKPVEAMVEYAADARNAQREEVISAGSDKSTKSKRHRKESISKTILY